MREQPRALETVDANWLIQQPQEEPQWIIEDILPLGLNLLTGAPKIGKSWLVLDIALKVSEGIPIWGYATRQCDVLYMALEDVYSRIKNRMWQLTDTASDRLSFAITAEGIGTGLVEQLEWFHDTHPDLGLVIIDTLQKVRTPSRDSAYAADYSDIGALKAFADAHDLSLLIIHHTRKQGDSDVFNTVSGTTGITGSADTTFVLTRQNRIDGSGTLTVAGRDIEFQEFKLRFKDCRWELVEKTSVEELEERDVPDSVLRVVDFMASQPCQWQGTASKLMVAAGVEAVSVAVFGKYLAQHKGFLEERGIQYKRRRVREGSILELSRI